MAQFPVSDQQGILDGLNYVLSGPGGTGQNFVGFSDWLPHSLTGNFRPPFTSADTMLTPSAFLYVAPIALSTSEMLDGRTWKYTFAAPQSIPPFALGQPITIAGVADPFYDGHYTPIGVIESTTTYVITRTNTTYTVVAPSTGGTATFNNMDIGYISTDCNGKVTVTNGTDRVFIAAQLNAHLYMEPLYTGTFNYVVRLNRYIGFVNPDPTNPDFRFSYDATIASKTYVLDTATLTPGQPFPSIETIFTSILDGPAPNYYWYILEINFETLTGTPIVAAAQFDQRSFSAQVIKA